MIDALNEALGITEEKLEIIFDKMGAIVNKYLHIARESNVFVNTDLINDINASFETREELAIAICPGILKIIRDHMEHELLKAIVKANVNESTEPCNQNEKLH